MSVFSKYRRNMSIDWGIDTKDFPFVKCSDLPLDTKIPFFGLFIAPDSGYGENPIAILEDQLFSMPQRFTDQVKEMMDDQAVVDCIKDKKAALVISTFESKKYKKTGYDIDFCEIDP